MTTEMYNYKPIPSILWKISHSILIKKYRAATAQSPIISATSIFPRYHHQSKIQLWMSDVNSFVQRVAVAWTMKYNFSSIIEWPEPNNNDATVELCTFFTIKWLTKLIPHRSQLRVREWWAGNWNLWSKGSWCRGVVKAQDCQAIAKELVTKVY